MASSSASVEDSASSLEVCGSLVEGCGGTIYDLASYSRSDSLLFPLGFFRLRLRLCRDEWELRDGLRGCCTVCDGGAIRFEGPTAEEA